MALEFKITTDLSNSGWILTMSQKFLWQSPNVLLTCTIKRVNLVQELASNNFHEGRFLSIVRRDEVYLIEVTLDDEAMHVSDIRTMLLAHPVGFNYVAARIPPLVFGQAWGMTMAIL
jgi:hypothetical protein